MDTGTAGTSVVVLPYPRHRAAVRPSCWRVSCPVVRSQVSLRDDAFNGRKTMSENRLPGRRTASAGAAHPSLADRRDDLGRNHASLLGLPRRAASAAVPARAVEQFRSRGRVSVCAGCNFSVWKVIAHVRRCFRRSIRRAVRGVTRRTGTVRPYQSRRGQWLLSIQMLSLSSLPRHRGARGWRSPLGTRIPSG